jgi:hypothetical protein
MDFRNFLHLFVGCENCPCKLALTPYDRFTRKERLNQGIPSLNYMKSQIVFDKKIQYNNEIDYQKNWITKCQTTMFNHTDSNVDLCL